MHTIKGIYIKVDNILQSNEPEKKYLIHKIDMYYETVKNCKSSTQVIHCDFKKKKILSFFEYLTDENLNKIF